MMEKQPYGTVLLKAAKILDFLSECESPQSLNTIAKKSDLTNSTALKILDTLLLIGYVNKDAESKKFSLGPSIIKYASKAINQLDIKQIVQPHLEKLQERTTETVHFGVIDKSSILLDKSNIVYIIKIESKNPVSLYTRIGNSIPLYCSAMGKAILADQTLDEINHYLSTTNLVKITKNTITTKKAFLEEIENIRHLGCAFDNCENEDDVFCIGASITLNGKNYGAFSVSTPKYRANEEFIQKAIKEILICKSAIISDLEQK